MEKIQEEMKSHRARTPYVTRKETRVKENEARKETTRAWFSCICFICMVFLVRLLFSCMLFLLLHNAINMPFFPIVLCPPFLLLETMLFFSYYVFLFFWMMFGFSLVMLLSLLFFFLSPLLQLRHVSSFIPSPCPMLLMHLFFPCFSLLFSLSVFSFIFSI